MRISIPDSLIQEPERVTRTQNAILDKLAIPVNSLNVPTASKFLVRERRRQEG
jgi:hypothetical protein